MGIHLTFRDIPEMRNVPAPERSRIWQAFLRAHGHLSREAALAFGPFLLSVIICVVYIPKIGIIPGVGVSACGPLVSSAFYIALMRKPFRKFLAEDSRDDTAA